MRIALAQLNPTVADVTGNTALVLEALRSADYVSVDLVVFPELVIVGYPPKDLVQRRDLVEANLAARDRIAAAATRCAVIVGYVDFDTTSGSGGVQNCAALCVHGRVAARYAKRLLPVYDVFDESRYFTRGEGVCVCPVPCRGGEVAVGLTICEDLWHDRQFAGRRLYGVDPIAETVAAGAELIVNVSASPFTASKPEFREALFGVQAREHGVPILYCGQVGGNDDLVFDGCSACFGPDGLVIARAKSFEPDVLIVDLPDLRRGANVRTAPPPEPRASVRAGAPSDSAGEPRASARAESPAEHRSLPAPATPVEVTATPLPGVRIEPRGDYLDRIWSALVLGARDYTHKCGFRGVVIGLSGGVDSAVTAALAVDALGAENVLGVAMPSRYSSGHSLEDARQLAENLGIEFHVVSIEEAHAAMERSLEKCFAGRGPDVTEENIQARLRGAVVMALANKFGRLVFSTGNKSELAVGYCTLYGDMCGGLALISDVPKTTVYELAKRCNARSGAAIIPQRTISKPPSAELRPDQCDQDTLPPYDVLDAILVRYVEHDLPAEEIIREGYDAATVHWVARAVDRNEYKRQQAAVGIKVTSRAFGAGRRMPIAARWRVGL
ncbi:MAG: NAD+ synthase [Phycisphaerales bacterium]|nr:MAG: NAD+ synthase [Phycisphaerales bacterium]